jgi:hypothetical protein
MEMAALPWEDLLGALWTGLASLHRGVLMMNLDVMLDRSADHKLQKHDKAIAARVEAAVRTTKTRLVILSDRPVEDALRLLPARWPLNSVSTGGWRSEKGTVVLRAGLKNKIDVVRRIARESVGIPNAYLGCDASDEAVFPALRAGAVGLLVRPQFQPAKSTILLQSNKEVIEFLEKWLKSLQRPQAAGA